MAYGRCTCLVAVVITWLTSADVAVGCVALAMWATPISRGLISRWRLRVLFYIIYKESPTGRCFQRCTVLSLMPKPDPRIPSRCRSSARCRSRGRYPVTPRSRRACGFTSTMLLPRRMPCRERRRRASADERLAILSVAICVWGDSGQQNGQTTADFAVVPIAVVFEAPREHPLPGPHSTPKAA